MRFAFRLCATALVQLAFASACGVSYIVPDTDPPLVMLVPDVGTAAHGTIRMLEEAPCTIDGATIDKGGSYRNAHLGEVVVDWTIPARPYQPELPVIVSPGLPEVYGISTEPTSAFFRLASFDVTAGIPANDRACTVACDGAPITTAYLVGTGLASDDELADAGMTLDDAKAVLIDKAAEDDASVWADARGPVGCTSLNAP